ncbi:excisionase family DNA-binding protein, partial [Streptomyces albiflaviniger]|nr:excisionase family DNA-binding protein [Streptomyces albiflaviniger]
MHTYRIGEAAALMGVSVDTLRRWVDSGRLTAE